MDEQSQNSTEDDVVAVLRQARSLLRREGIPPRRASPEQSPSREARSAKKIVMDLTPLCGDLHYRGKSTITPR